MPIRIDNIRDATYLNQAVKTTSTPTFASLTASVADNVSSTFGATAFTTVIDAKLWSISSDSDGSHGTVGILALAEYTNATTDTTKGQMGVNGYARVVGNGGCSHSLYGVLGGRYGAFNKGSGTVVKAGGIEVMPVSNDSTGVVTNAYGLYVENSVNGGGGSIGTAYSIYDAGQTVAGTNWGLYGLSAQNYLSGTLTLGTMTSGSVLFAGTSGIVSQDNTNIRWDDTNKILRLGNTDQAGTTPLPTNGTDGFCSSVSNTTTGVHRGGLFKAEYTGTATGSSQLACNVFAQNISTGTIGLAVGQRGGGRNISSGTITDIRGFDTLIYNISTGTITNAYAFRAAAPANNGGGTFSNWHGLYVDASTVGSVSNIGVALVGDSSLANIINCGSAIVFGAEKDAAIAYNNTDLVVQPQLVGTGDLKLLAGSVNTFTGYKVQGTAGLGTVAVPLVIVTAAITPVGATGTMTFVGGILTAQVAAT